MTRVFFSGSTQALLLLSVFAVGCGKNADDTKNSFVIGGVIDQSGSLTRPSWSTAAQLAVSDANAGLEAAGGYADLRFALKLGDSRNEHATALTRAVALRDEGARAMLTDSDEDAISIIQTTYDSDSSNDVTMPTVCMGCSASSLFSSAATDSLPARQLVLRNVDHWGFRTVAHARPETNAIAHYFLFELFNRGDLNTDGNQKLAIEAVKDISGSDFLNDLQTAMGSIVVEPVRHEREILVDEHDWNTDLVDLTDDRNEALFGRVDGVADVILDSTYPLYAAALSRSYFEGGTAVAKIGFAHTHNFRNEQILVKLGAYDLEGQTGFSHAILDNCDTSGATFATALEAVARTPPGYLDAQTYDAVMVIELGVLVAMNDNGLTAQTEVSAPMLRDAMTKISSRSDDFANGIVRVPVYASPNGFAAAVSAVANGSAIDYIGASGPVDFDDLGNVVGNIVEYVVQSGHFVDTEVFACTSDPATCPIRAPNPACSF